MNKTTSQIQVVLIGGCPRSGTTLLGSLLGGHSKALTTPESHFKQTGYKFLRKKEGQISTSSLKRKWESDFRYKLWNISWPPSIPESENLGPADIGQVVLRFVTEFGKERNAEFHYWVDHTPHNTEDHIMLSEMFPESKFIHLVRDPRAVAASIVPLDWGPNSASKAAEYWAYKVSFGLAAEQYNESLALRVKYEDLVNDTERELQRICDFLGWNFEAKMLSGSGFKVPEYTAGQHQLVGKGTDTSRLTAWRKKLSPWEIEAIEQKVGGLMDYFGYERTNTHYLGKPPIGARIRTLLLPMIDWYKRRKFNAKKDRHAQ